MASLADMLTWIRNTLVLAVSVTFLQVLTGSFAAAGLVTALLALLFEDGHIDWTADFVFALLWLVIVSCFVKVFVQAELGRYTISSGQTTRNVPHSARARSSTVWWCCSRAGGATRVASFARCFARPT